MTEECRNQANFQIGAFSTTSRGGAVAARRAHNPKVVGSSPTPATNNDTQEGPGDTAGAFILIDFGGIQECRLSNQLHDSAAKYVAGRLYARRLISDALQEIYAESLVYLALSGSAPEAGWRPAGEGDPWDLENDNHCHVQVKQSAALPAGSNGKNPGNLQAISFDIHPGKKGRQTHIYVFVWHPESDPDVADHRDTEQWRFCVMPEDELPEPVFERKTQRISLKRLEALAANIGLKAVSYDQLAVTFNRIAKVMLERDERDGRRAHEAMERIRRGEDRIVTEAELSASLGLDS